MPDISSLKLAIAAIFTRHESPCLWFSGGSDSRLLLEVMLEVEEPFGILIFDTGWTREQKRQVDAVILRHNLQTFSYPPASNTLVGQNGDLALVSQYAIDGYGNTASLVRDLVDDSTRCFLDGTLEAPRPGPAPAEWGAYIWGLRGDDRHWVRETPLIDAGEQTIGTKKFLFPLLEWNRQEVREALKTEYGIDLSGEIELGDINCCSRCLHGTEDVLCPKSGAMIPAVKWDKHANLAAVREVLR